MQNARGQPAAAKEAQDPVLVDFLIYRTAKRLAHFISSHEYVEMKERVRSQLTTFYAEAAARRDPRLVQSAPPALARGGAKRAQKEACNVCVFCRNNAPNDLKWKEHSTRDEAGRVTCPILRKHVCPYCGQTGDAAHTIRYCAKKKKDELKIEEIV